MMVETMGRTDTPKERIENLLRVRQTHFPEQPLDWEYLLDKFAEPTVIPFSDMLQERLKFLFMCGMTERVKALAFKVWRDHITTMIQTSNFKALGGNFILRSIQEKLAYFEDVLPRLKEVTTLLELAIWMMKMNEKIHQDMDIQSQKRSKTGESSTRHQCRVICGADVVIGHVLPFLVTA
jgi:hypothetical protein